MRRLALLLLLLTACSSGTTADRTIAVTMRDNTYAPEEITVQRGETVEFRFTNRGKAIHDAFIGDERAQLMHEEEMHEHGDHGSGSGITVEPGEQASITHRFGEEGTFEVGCHQAGHYDGGMRMRVVVGP